VPRPQVRCQSSQRLTTNAPHRLPHQQLRTEQVPPFQTWNANDRPRDRKLKRLQLRGRSPPSLPLAAQKRAPSPIDRPGRRPGAAGGKDSGPHGAEQVGSANSGGEARSRASVSGLRGDRSLTRPANSREPRDSAAGLTVSDASSRAPYRPTGRRGRGRFEASPGSPALEDGFRYGLRPFRPGTSCRSDKDGPIASAVFDRSAAFCDPIWSLHKVGSGSPARTRENWGTWDRSGQTLANSRNSRSVGTASVILVARRWAYVCRVELVTWSSPVPAARGGSDRNCPNSLEAGAGCRHDLRTTRVIRPCRVLVRGLQEAARRAMVGRFARRQPRGRMVGDRPLRRRSTGARSIRSRPLARTCRECSWAVVHRLETGGFERGLPQSASTRDCQLDSGRGSICFGRKPLPERVALQDGLAQR